LKKDIDLLKETKATIETQFNQNVELEKEKLANNLKASQ
jgi:hypothetical protein